MIRLSYCFIVLLLITSCSGFAVYQASFNFLKDNLIPNKRELIAKEFYDQQKYSFALVRIGNASEIKMVLASIKDGYQQWVSSDGFSIFTNSNGRILKTQGLKNDVNYVPISKLSNRKVDFIVDFYSPELLKIKGMDIYKKNPESITYKYFIDESIKVSQTNFITQIPTLRWSQEGALFYRDKTPVFVSQKIHPHFPRIKMNFYYKFK